MDTTALAEEDAGPDGPGTFHARARRLRTVKLWATGRSPLDTRGAVVGYGAGSIPRILGRAIRMRTMKAWSWIP